MCMWRGDLIFAYCPWSNLSLTQSSVCTLQRNGLSIDCQLLMLRASVWSCPLVPVFTPRGRFFVVLYLLILFDLFIHIFIYLLFFLFTYLFIVERRVAENVTLVGPSWAHACVGFLERFLTIKVWLFFPSEFTRQGFRAHKMVPENQNFDKATKQQQTLSIYEIRFMLKHSSYCSWMSSWR